MMPIVVDSTLVYPIHVRMSMDMVEGLPGTWNSALIVPTIRNACFEAWLVNVRLMCEFLLVVEPGKEPARSS